MKILFASLFVLITINSTLAQFDCNTIQVNASVFYLDQTVDNSVTMDYSYDMSTQPMVFYPSFEIVLNDSSEIAFRDFYATSMLGTGTLDYAIIYKNPSITVGSTFIGNFTINGNTDTEGFTCLFPVSFIFQSDLAIENHDSFENTILFPNPSNGNFSLEFGKQIDQLTATLRNSAGQLVSITDHHSIDTIQVNISGDSGLYFLELLTPNESLSLIHI